MGGSESKGLHMIGRMMGTMMSMCIAYAWPSDDFSTVQRHGYRHDFALPVCVGWTV